MERPVGEILRGGGKTRLHIRRCRARALLLRSACGVCHQPDIHSSVRCTAFAGLIFFNRFVLAQSHDIDLVWGDVVLRAKVLDH